MKYAWLKPYVKFFQIVEKEDLRKKNSKKMLSSFYRDCSYHFVVPKNYRYYFKKVKLVPIAELSDCGLELLLMYYLYEGKIESGLLEQAILDRTILNIIKAMLKVVSSSLPASDYSFSEMLEEVIHLPESKATLDKLSTSNVAACFSCRNVFYVDMIYQKTKKKLCLCPYCNQPTLYFDCDYIPMDSNFVMLAYLYNQDQVPFWDLCQMVGSKIKLSRVIEKKMEYYSFYDRCKYYGNLFEEESQTLMSVPFLKEKDEIDSEVEDAYFYALLHSYHDMEEKHKASGTILFDFFYQKEQQRILAITSVLSLLFYFQLYYFSSLQEITFVVLDDILYHQLEEVLHCLQEKRIR